MRNDLFSRGKTVSAFMGVPSGAAYGRILYSAY